MAHTFDKNIVSDLYKDAFGQRPGETFWANWSRADDDGKQDLWQWVVDAQEAAMAEYVAGQKKAVTDFEAEVTYALEVGASDRATALRWMAGAAGVSDSEWQDHEIKSMVYAIGAFRLSDQTAYENEIKEAIRGYEG